MTEPQKPVSRSERWQRLRLWLWKVLYGLRLFQRGSAPGMKFGSYLPWCLGEAAQQGWLWHLEVYESVEAALRESPIDAADEEMSNWDPA